MPALASLVLAANVVVLSVFAEMVRTAPWEMDEYFLVASYRDHGLTFLADRLRFWSPRPVSEGLLYAYALAVDVAGRPLSAWFLGGLWALFIGAALVTMRARGVVWRLLAASSVLVLMVLGRRPMEVFFWPAGAAAYLVAFAALTLAFFTLADGRRTGRLLAASLLLAALSVELGAVFVASYAGLRLLQDGMRAAVSRRVRPLLSWDAAPLLAISLGVLASLATHRANKADEFADGDTVLVHHAWPSVAAAWHALPLDVLSLSGLALWPPAFTLNLALGLVAKAAFAAGFLGCWQRVSLQAPARALAAFAAAAFVTAPLALAASYYQFGSPCCARQGEMRQALMILGLAACAVLLAGRTRRIGATLTGLSLAVATALPLAAMLLPLLHDERGRAAVAAVVRQNWASGRAPGPDMVFHLRPHQELLPDGELPPGRYVTGDPSNPWTAQGLFWFFHKDAVTVLPADAP